MNSKDLYDRFLTYFKIEEIVSPTCFEQYKQRGDYFFLSRFDPRLLYVMIFIREGLGRSITVNDWFWDGNLTQRGLRDNLTPLVKNKSHVYLSGHVLGAAFDFDVEGMKAYQVRNWLQQVAEELPYKIRLENKYKGKVISWVHLDVIDEPKNSKVYLFNV